MNNDNYFIILEKTPFPGEWLPAHGWLLQHAEWNTRDILKFKHYHDKGRVIMNRKSWINREIFYSLEDAMTIIGFCTEYRNFADYQIIEMNEWIGGQ